MSEPTLIKPVAPEASSAAPFSYAQAARAAAAPSTSSNTAEQPSPAATTVATPVLAAEPATTTANATGTKATTSEQPAEQGSITTSNQTSVPLPVSPSTSQTPHGPNGTQTESGSASLPQNTEASSGNPSIGNGPSKQDGSVSEAQSPKTGVATPSSPRAAAAVAAPQETAAMPAVNVWEKRAKERSQLFVQSNGGTNPTPSQAASTPKSEHESVADPAARLASSQQNAQQTQPEAESSTDGAKIPRKDSLTDKQKGSKRAAKTPLTPLPSVEDQTLWPTPDVVAVDEKKKAQEKASAGVRQEVKPEAVRPQGKKTSWLPMEINVPVRRSPPESGRRNNHGSATSGNRQQRNKDAMSRGNSYHNTSADEAGAPNFDSSRKGRPGNAQTGFSAQQKSDFKSSSGKPGSRDNNRPNSRGNSTAQTQGKPGQKEDELSNSSRDAATSSVAAGAAGSIDAAGRAQGHGRTRQPRRFDGMDRQQPNVSNRPIDSNSGATQSGDTAGPSGSQQRPDLASGPAAANSGAAAHSGTGHYGHTSNNSRHSFSDRRGFSGRGGRGRGGRGGAAPFNPHIPAGAHFGAGQPGSSGMGQFNHNQRSPNHSVFSAENPNAFYMNQPGRPYRHNGRTNSVPNEGFHPGYAAGSAVGLGPIQTSFPGSMYEHNLGPMTAIPYTNYMEPYAQLPPVMAQLEWYLSADNLCGDFFLRKNMDSNGFVPLTVIAEFNLLRKMCADFEIIKLACFESKKIEYRIGPKNEDLVRPIALWEKFLLPIGMRVEVAQKEVYDESELKYPARPTPEVYPRYLPAQYQSLAPPLRSAPLNASMVNGSVPEFSNPEFIPNSVTNQSSQQGSPSGQPSKPVDEKAGGAPSVVKASEAPNPEVPAGSSQA